MYIKQLSSMIIFAILTLSVQVVQNKEMVHVWADIAKVHTYSSNGNIKPNGFTQCWTSSLQPKKTTDNQSAGCHKCAAIDFDSCIYTDKLMRDDTSLYYCARHISNVLD